MAQQLRGLGSLPKNSGSIPSTHRMAHNYVLLLCQNIQHSLLTSADTRNSSGVQIYMQAKYSYEQNN